MGKGPRRAVPRAVHAPVLDAHAKSRHAVDRVGWGMAELPAHVLDVAVRIGQIASEPASIAQRAEALLTPLGRVFPFQAVWIGLLDPDRRGFLSLVMKGYNEASGSYLRGTTVHDEVERLGLDKARPPMRAQDMPIPPGDLISWTQYLWPNGFREGLAVGLFTPDGRHLGVLGFNTDTPAHPTAAARDFIGRLAPTIANAIDPMRTVAAAARIIHGATAGVALSHAGRPLPLPGLPGHPILEPGSTVLAVAQRLAGERRHATFLSPDRGVGERARFMRVTVFACPPQPVYDLRAVVVVSSPATLHGLTRRQLEILGLLVEGWSNARIALTLLIAESTVATHVEQILAKLDVVTRTAAAVRAVREGLYVPRQLGPGSAAYR
jgi:DNA-binding CsgD family transcriptional regulator